MAQPSRQDGLFRALLRLFPSEFRGDFGDQMADDFRDQRHEVTRGHRTIGLLQLWARTAIDLVQRAPREHLDVFWRAASYAVRVLRRRPASTATGASSSP